MSRVSSMMDRLRESTKGQEKKILFGALVVLAIIGGVTFFILRDDGGATTAGPILASTLAPTLAPPTEGPAAVSPGTATDAPIEVTSAAPVETDANTTAAPTTAEPATPMPTPT